MKLNKICVCLCMCLSVYQAAEATDANSQKDDAKFSYDGKTEFVVRDSTFSETPPEVTPKIKQKLDNAKWIIGNSVSDPILPEKIPADSVTIMGESEATEEQMLAMLLKHNPHPKLTCSPKELVHYYYVEATLEGIRPDLALSQAFKETGYFNYGGDVLPEQNNFCGLGAVGGGARGLSFKTAQIGARAHIQHIKCYASKEPPKSELVDPRYELVKKNRPDIFGSVPTWTGLNGKWAVPGTYYGQDIVERGRLALTPDGSKKSIARGRELTAKNPTDFYSYAYRGIAYLNNGDFRKAIQDFSLSLFMKETWEIYYNRALTHEKQNNFPLAIEDYGKAIAMAPKEDILWYNRGLIYLSQKEYDKALYDFKEALIIHPQMVNATVAMFLAHIKLERYDAAWTDLYKASQINTENPLVKDNRQILEKCYEIRKD